MRLRSGRIRVSRKDRRWWSESRVLVIKISEVDSGDGKV